MVYGRGWSHSPTIPFLSGWYTSHTSLIIILYPARDPATFCCFSRLRSYFRPTVSSSWRGNVLWLSETANYGVSMTTITLVDSLWHHNDNCCYTTMRSQGQVFCLLTLEFKCHLWYCSSQEVDLSLSHSAVLHYIFNISIVKHPTENHWLFIHVLISIKLY